MRTRLTPAPFARWADVVPGQEPVAVDVLLRPPDHGVQYEVVEGALVHIAGSGGKAPEPPH